MMLNVFQFSLLISTISIVTAGLLNWQEFGGPYHQNDAQYKQLERLLSKKQELQKRQEKYNVCRTKECFTIAAEFWESMNKSVDPCEDFYEYACGKWKIYNPIPPSEMQWSPITKMQEEIVNKIRDLLEQRVQQNEALPVKQVKKFYQSCMNVDAIEKVGIRPLESILIRNGGWPMIMEPGEWDSEIFSWKKVHDFYSHLSEISALYEISVTKDRRGIDSLDIDEDNDEDEMKMAISIIPPKLPSVVLKSGAFDRKRMYQDGSYAKFIKKVALIFASERGAHINENQIVKDVEDIIEIEKILGNYNTFPNYNSGDYYTFNELQRYYDMKTTTPDSKINWRKTIEDLFAEANVKIEGDEYVQVNMEKFLSKLPSLLEANSPRALVNYIHWHFLSNMLPYTGSKIQELEYEIKKEQAGIKEEIPRWKTCVDNIKMKHAVSYMFVKKYFEEQMRIDAEQIFTTIKKEMAKHILKADWLDDSVRKMELEKLQKMRKNIGYPEWYNNITMLNNFYRGIPVGHNFLINILSYQRYSLKKNLRTLKVKPQKDEWYLHPIVVNAFYILDANSLTIPAADFQLPFYTIEKLQTINYGALGILMGHEVSHGFADSGSQYDQDGNKIKWPTNIEEKYENKTKCFVKQQNDFYKDYLEDDTSGENTVSESLNSFELFGEIDDDLKKLGENIADSLGLDTVFDAFEEEEREVRQPRLPGFEDLNNEQLFFLTFAKLWCENSTPEFDEIVKLWDSHSKQRYRVISSLQNSEGFAKAYNCPVGSKMNPARKCKLWK